jgi:hypothetical protein
MSLRQMNREARFMVHRGWELVDDEFMFACRIYMLSCGDIII